MEGAVCSHPDKESMKDGFAFNEVWNPENKYPKNDPMDPGVAGLKDQPVNGDVNCNGCADPESSEIEVPSGSTTYLKGQFLGKGGFAQVHLLLDLSTRLLYAGKIIPKERITKPHHLQKISREISIHRSLIHKHVVRLHHYFENKVNAYMVLEYCPQKSLLHVLKHRYSVTEPEARYYLRQLVDGVKYIHSQKVIHRDLKPGNMFLSDNMTVKIGDFGLATLVDGNGKFSICGTPNYIAPEVLNKLSYSFEADVWAIGCILYAMLVGHPPFETASLRETYRRIVSNKYNAPASISECSRKLIAHLLQSNPKKRLELEKINSHEFFANNFTPESLIPEYCYRVPTFVDSISDRHQPGDFNNFSSSCSNNNNKAVPNHQYIPKHMKTYAQTKVTFRQKLSNVLHPDKAGKKKETSVCNMYQTLVDCLRLMADYAQNSTVIPKPAMCCPLFITKWIDYSNKYGFGFQLSDKSVGVLFNDNTRISFNSDGSIVEFHDMYGSITSHPRHTVPDVLHSRLTLLEHFAEYMQENLTDGGDTEGLTSERSKHYVPQIKRWLRTNTAIIMELNNGTLQINFFRDHTKIILSTGKYGYLVTYINKARQSTSYWLHHLAVTCCEKSIISRLRFAASVLPDFTEM